MPTCITLVWISHLVETVHREVWFIREVQRKSVIDSSQLPGNGSGVLKKKKKNPLNKCPTGARVYLWIVEKSHSKPGYHYPKHRTRHWNMQTPTGSNNPLPLPLPPQPLISSDSNQATNSNTIVIHVVNYFVLQKKKCFFSLPCSVFKLKRWGWTMESGTVTVVWEQW